MMVLDAKELLERLSGDAELLAEVVALFLEDCPDRVQAIDAAVRLGDPTGVRATAHALKGAAGNMSAHRLFTAAEALEQLAEAGDLALMPAAFDRIKAAADELLPVLRDPLTFAPAPALRPVGGVPR